MAHLLVSPAEPSPEQDVVPGGGPRGVIPIGKRRSQPQPAGVQPRGLQPRPHRLQRHDAAAAEALAAATLLELGAQLDLELVVDDAEAAPNDVEAGQDDDDDEPEFQVV